MRDFLYLPDLYPCLDLQSFTRNLRLTLAQYSKSLVSVFQEVFASINKIFMLAGRMSTRLSFY